MLCRGNKKTVSMFDLAWREYKVTDTAPMCLMLRQFDLQRLSTEKGDRQAHKTQPWQGPKQSGGRHAGIQVALYILLYFRHL
jgi:hypothetical protein